ncbi:MAG TPA: PadR family transcriptional regulator [Chloroflexi bacterium]|nr:PadR family transcriptional regulator [Chloroflexota bacterium]
MDDLLDYLPLREPTFLILLSLAPGPKHGYAILKEVEALSEGRVLLSTGTLYGAIKRLLDEGWIRRVDDPLPNGTERERKAYELTETGRRAMNAEVERLRKLVNVAQIQAAEEA